MNEPITANNEFGDLVSNVPGFMSSTEYYSC